MYVPCPCYLQLTEGSMNILRWDCECRPYSRLIIFMKGNWVSHSAAAFLARVPRRTLLFRLSDVRWQLSAEAH
jgi:hypothetical protein